MELGPADLAAIERAIHEAEERTSGELYCVVADECGDYGETPLAWAAGVALLAPALLLLAGVNFGAPDLFGGWTAAQAVEAAERAGRDALVGAIVLQAVLFVLTLLIVGLTPVRRALTPRAFKRERVRRCALEQFSSKNLHMTRERTGVLIFVSFAEHMAELIADEGIAADVEPRVWDEAMAALTAGLRRGQPGEGISAAIRMCADVLAERFPADPHHNPNELPNAVVVLPKA